jgi:hypothetical protein
MQAAVEGLRAKSARVKQNRSQVSALRARGIGDIPEHQTSISVCDLWNAG